jgi:hypothetical protein
MTTPNITNIPAPRVPFVDERTGLISREWYRFLLNLFTLTGSGQSDMTVQDILSGPSVGDSQAQIAELQKQIEVLESINSQQSAYLAEVHKQIDDLNLLPPILNDDRTKLDKLVVKAGSATAPSITTEGDENTGIYFAAADVVAVTTGGVERIRFNNTNTEIAGHLKVEAVTSTGATGTGKLVFDTSPALITPNLGTPSALVGTNITGTASGLSVGYADSAGSAPTSGFSGTVTPVTSITVSNGLVTAVS